MRPLPPDHRWYVSNFELVFPSSDEGWLVLSWLVNVDWLVILASYQHILQILQMMINTISPHIVSKKHIELVIRKWNIAVDVLQTSVEWQSRWSTLRGRREWRHRTRNTHIQLSTNTHAMYNVYLYVVNWYVQMSWTANWNTANTEWQRNRATFRVSLLTACTGWT